jgi:hypothetical protein
MDETESAEKAGGAGRVEAGAPPRAATPAPVMAKVRWAVNAGLFRSVLALFATMSAGTLVGWLNFVLILALTAGILVKSRVCAVMMLASVVIVLGLRWRELRVFDFLVAPPLIVYFALGALGTFQYHRWRRS